MAYSYKPERISAYGIDRMRFELGDTQVSGGGSTAALSDEEYVAMLQMTAGTALDADRDYTVTADKWHRARLHSLRAIVARFAMMVDMSADGVNMQFSQRYDRFKALLKDEEAKGQRVIYDRRAMGSDAADGGHYFYAGMHDNGCLRRPKGTGEIATSPLLFP